jgi:hypothetical protein
MCSGLCLVELSCFLLLCSGWPSVSHARRDIFSSPGQFHPVESGYVRSTSCMTSAVPYQLFSNCIQVDMAVNIKLAKSAMLTVYTWSWSQKAATGLIDESIFDPRTKIHNNQPQVHICTPFGLVWVCFDSHALESLLFGTIFPPFHASTCLLDSLSMQDPSSALSLYLLSLRDFLIS